MNNASRKPAPRSRTPEPQRNDGGAAARAVVPATVQFHSRRPLAGRGAKSENDLRKTTKSKETLTNEDKQALAYNAYLQSVLRSLHDAEFREKKEKEIAGVMEKQQLELIALEEENHYLDVVLMTKIRLFKEMKEEIEKKTKLCEQIFESVNERELDEQIKIIEDKITKLSLKNFKLPDTNEDKNAVIDTIKEISKLLDTIPEMKKIAEPVNTLNTSLVKAEELKNVLEKSKEECLKKVKLAETLLYDKLYLETKVSK